MARRLLALAAAVAMVAIALAVRNRGDDDSRRGGSGALQLVCATELDVVCDALAGSTDIAVTVEPAGVTAARLRTAAPDDADIDGWLTPGPWGEIVDVSRPASAEQLFDDPGAPLARSPFVIALWKNKRSAFACPEPVDYGCVGDAVITRGFRLGTAGDEQAEGVLADAALSAGHAKRANFATNDLNETDLADWITAVDASADSVTRNPGGRSFTELLTFGAASADGFLSTEAAVRPQFMRAAKRPQLDLVYPTPTATADVVFAPRATNRGKRLAKVVRSDRVRVSLRDAGWRVAGLARAAGLTPIAGVPSTRRLPAGDGLPSPGVLYALRDVTK